MLKDGNTVQIGELLLTFSGRLVQISDGDEEQSTVYAAIDVVNQSSSKNLPVVRPEVKLRALRLISQELGGTLVLGELLDRIFNSLFELFPRAERGFVLVRDPVSETLVPEAIRSRTGPAGRADDQQDRTQPRAQRGTGDPVEGPGQGVPGEPERLGERDPLA